MSESEIDADKTSEEKEKQEAKTQRSHKKAIHLGALVGLVVLVFGVDQLLFGRFASIETASLKELCGSTADLLVGVLLAAAALQAYLWQSNPSKPTAKAKTPVLDSISPRLKVAQANLNRELDRAFQIGC